MGPVGSRCGRPASRGGRVRPGLAGNGEVAARARAPQARVRARRRRPPSQGGHGFSGPHHWNGFSGPHRWNGFGAPRRWNGFSGPRCWNGFSGPHRWRRASRPAPGQARPSATPRACAARPPCTRADLWWADSLTSRRTGTRPGPHPARENGTYSSRERYLLAVRTVLITWTGQGPGCGSQAVRFSLPVGVSASCVGVGPSSAGPRAATWGCLLVVRGPGPGPEVAGEAVVAASGVFIGGLGGGVAHSSWYLGRAVGVIPTFSRPGRRR